MLPAVLSAVSTGLNVANSIDKQIDNIMPMLHQECNVVVQGAPYAKRFDLYWIAVSAAFGHIRNLTLMGKLLPNGVIMIEYNSELNYVRFYCKQVTSWKEAWANARGRFGGVSQVMYGPKDELRGGSWQWYAGAIPGIPGKDDVGKTGWENETILTKNSTYIPVSGVEMVSANPEPFDESSRGAPTIAADPKINNISGWEFYNYPNPEYLVYQMLSGPCDAKTVMADSKNELPQPPRFAEPPAPAAE